MRKVVNGRVYDTDTAKLVCEWDNGEMPSGLGYVYHGLHRKKTGEFFLHVCGGAATNWAKPTETGGTRRAEHVVLATYDEARALVEAHGTADEYEAVFGLCEDEPAVVITVRGVDAQAKALLDREASKTGRQLGEIVSECILAKLG